jgi:hypothetical protein
MQVTTRSVDAPQRSVGCEAVLGPRRPGRGVHDDWRSTETRGVNLADEGGRRERGRRPEERAGRCGPLETAAERAVCHRCNPGEGRCGLPNILGSEVEATSTSAADTGNTFRYDASGDQYIYNLATKTFTNGNTTPLSAGTWQIRIAQYNGTTEIGTMGTVIISLKK